jgi:hypothetical protein
MLRMAMLVISAGLLWKMPQFGPLYQQAWRKRRRISSLRHETRPPITPRFASPSFLRSIAPNLSMKAAK